MSETQTTEWLPEWAQSLPGSGPTPGATTFDIEMLKTWQQKWDRFLAEAEQELTEIVQHLRLSAPAASSPLSPAGAVAEASDEPVALANEVRQHRVPHPATTTSPQTTAPHATPQEDSAELALSNRSESTASGSDRLRELRNRLSQLMHESQATDQPTQSAELAPQMDDNGHPSSQRANTRSGSTDAAEGGQT